MYEKGLDPVPDAMFIINPALGVSFSSGTLAGSIMVDSVAAATE